MEVDLGTILLWAVWAYLGPVIAIDMYRSLTEKPWKK